MAANGHNKKMRARKRKHEATPRARALVYVSRARAVCLAATTAGSGAYDGACEIAAAIRVVSSSVVASRRSLGPDATTRGGNGDGSGGDRRR